MALNGRKWNGLKNLLERAGPLAYEDFEPDDELLPYIQVCRILVIGAGGLGCELLKDLALMGFRSMDVIDMDTIDISNLNRQFLFGKSDVGKPKAEVAAKFVNGRISGCQVIPHFNKIQDFDVDFYKDFQIVVCGLDSIIARRWMNAMLVSMLRYNDDGTLDQSSIIPLVDGGTEGFKGNVRVILPGMTACIECTLQLYPPQVNFPLCTIAHTPRLPEHCIEYVRLLLWPQEKPFAESGIDGDNPEHIEWVYEKSLQRAEKYNISGVTYRLTQGVVKRIIPAVASTNAVVAAACATEVFKMATMCYAALNNYMNFNNGEGIYMFAFEAERKEDCLVCSQIPQMLEFRFSDKLEAIIDYLKVSGNFQMKSPGVTTKVDGKNKTLFINNVSSLMEKTKPNLKRSLKELGLRNGHEIYVSDQTLYTTATFKLRLLDDMSL